MGKCRAATFLLQVSTRLRKATPAVVVTAKRVRYALQLLLEITNARVRWNHVFDDNHFPGMSFDNICQSDGRPIAFPLKLLRKLLSPYLVGKYHIEINITGSAQIVSFGLQPPKRISVVVVRMKHCGYYLLDRSSSSCLYFFRFGPFGRV